MTGIKKWSAVIFDLDGTLLDTLEDIADAMNTVLKKHSFPRHTYQNYRYLVGKGIEQLVISAIPLQSRDNRELIKIIIQEMILEYEQHCNKKSKPYPGIKELLQELKKRGILLAVLSNKKDDFTKKCLQSLLPEITFDLICGARPGIPYKPDPTSALNIADFFSLNTDKIIYLGDTDVDMQTAAAAGMYAVGAAWGFRPEAELLAHGAQMIIQEPLELLFLFK